MIEDQTIVFGALAFALVFFIWERWRYDIVALLALLIVTAAGIVPADEAFAGFGHPAVITVAAVLVLSRGLINAGLIDRITELVSQFTAAPMMQVAVITGLVALFSAFMNNVGAMAFLLPVAIRMARKNEVSPSVLLMPLAFGSLLGGMITLIGTPPNIIIAKFRAGTGSPPFQMFDFAPVGLIVAVLGVLFITLIGWRLIPHRKGQNSLDAILNIAEYTSEIVIPEGSAAARVTVRELENSVDSYLVVVALIREGEKKFMPPGYSHLQAGDILILEAEPDALKVIVDTMGVELEGSRELGEEALGSDDVSLMEAVVMPASRLEGRSVRNLGLRSRYGLNLLALARQGVRLRKRLNQIRLRTGDVVLLQGRKDSMYETLSDLGILPLAERGLRIGKNSRALVAVSIFAAAIALSAFGLFPVQVSFIAAAVVMVILQILTVREIYDSIDWSLIVLLGAMIPVGEALETTGGAKVIAEQLARAGGGLSPLMTMALVLIVTMFLSDLMNNAATAVVMAPIAIGIAQGLGVSADPFLMSVAVGASCAFLTPIGHQSNTLVMGPGGYKFSDYWRMGLPLEALIVVAAVPLISWVWPLTPG